MKEATALPSSSPPPESDPSGRRIWRVGTLTYTAAGLFALFGWLLFGDFAWALRERSVGAIAQWYLNQLKVPNLVFGILVTSFPALVTLIVAPVISVKSDRYRSRWGRRIPFLLVTTPLAVFGMIGLAFTPLLSVWLRDFFLGQNSAGAWLHSLSADPAFRELLLGAGGNEMLISLICFGTFWAAFEVASAAGQAVLGGLINDVVPRNLLGRFYGLFRAVSLIDGMIFNYWIMGRVPDYFTLILLCLGVFYGLAFTLMCLKVREGQYPPPPPREPSAGRPLAGAFAGFRRYFRECFSNPYYLSVFGMMTAAALSFVPVNTFVIPFAQSVGLSMDVYGKFLALTYFISLLLSFFLGWLADLFHPLRMCMAILCGYVLVSAWGGLFASNASNFLVAWVLHGVLSGSYFTCAASLGQRLFPHDRYAQFASAVGMVMSPAMIIVAPLLGTVIDLSGNVYRYVFVAGCLLALTALAAAFVVHRNFLRLGGPKNYTAPA